MDRNAAVLVIVLVLIAGMAGFAHWRGSPEDGCSPAPMPPNGTAVRIYVMIENENAAFEMALFSVKVGDAKLSETNVPVLAYEGKPGTVHLSVRGSTINWNGVKFEITGTVSLDTEPGRSYLVTLTPVHEPGVFLMEVDKGLSGVIGQDVPSTVFLDDYTVAEDVLKQAGFSDELEANRKLRERYLRLWKETGNLSYLQIHRDLTYHLRALALMAKLDRLSETAVRTYTLDILATDYYYSRFEVPGRKDLILVFSNDSPYYGAIRAADGPIKSRLPFVYYTARGFNLYPVSALHWAHVYFERRDYAAMTEILDELLPFAVYSQYEGTEYALFPVYFHFQNASVPWVSGYAQGMAAGLYAAAYNITGNETYLITAELFLNSFELPLSENGFVAQTKYGPWYLEYNYYPDELVLNGHIIALQGLYYYWEVTGDKRAYDLFWSGAMSVRKALPDFDTGSWSRYASIYDTSSEFYHRLHIKLLVWLYSKTGEETFLEYAEKWNGYLEKKGLKPENIGALLEQMRNSP
ncbi:D-glucuronyl C5-epimerase family protein [Thermococcus barossii]|nr:D-glucuronyl C5-epimerase family protein [Thermococcus barossii]